MKKDEFISQSFLGLTRGKISWSEMNEGVKVSANEAARFLGVDVGKVKEAAEYLGLTYSGEGRKKRWGISLYDTLRLHMFIYCCSKGDSAEIAKKKALVGVGKRRALMDFFSGYELVVAIPEPSFKGNRKHQNEILSKLEKTLGFYESNGSSLGWGQKLRTYLYELRDMGDLEKLTLNVTFRKKRVNTKIDKDFEEFLDSKGK